MLRRNTQKKLKDVCRTRWIERIDGMDVFQELFEPIVTCLEEMATHEIVCNADTSAKAASF